MTLPERLLEEVIVPVQKAITVDVANKQHRCQTRMGHPSTVTMGACMQVRIERNVMPYVYWNSFL